MTPPTQRVLEQRPSPWGLMRISSKRPLPPDEKTYEYTYDDNACGEGVTIYILGGTIQATHVDFNYSTPVIYDKSDVFNLADTHKKYPNSRIRLPDINRIDYGTLVAGIAAGSGSGIAKKATIVQVHMNDIMKATDKILLDKQVLKAEALEDDAFFPAVVNISSSYVNTPEVNDSLVKLIKDGIHVVVAAGDEDKPLPKLGRDLESIIWVGASTLGDKKWKYSNYGPGVDLFAPGEDIKSATRSSGDIYSEATHSGTAFAAPHVTGIIACLLSHPSYSGFEPKMMKEKILAMAEDVVNHVPLLESVGCFLGTELIVLIMLHYDETDQDKLHQQLFTKEMEKIVNKTYFETHLLPVMMAGALEIQKVVYRVHGHVRAKIHNTLKLEDILQSTEDISQSKMDLLKSVKLILWTELMELIMLHYVEMDQDKLCQLFKARVLKWKVKETYIDEHLLPSQTSVVMAGIQRVKQVVDQVDGHVRAKIKETLKEENVQPSAIKLFTTTPKLASCCLDLWNKVEQNGQVIN